MSGSNKRLFANGEFLAVVGSDKQYWLCKCRQHVYKDKTQHFWVQWLEKESSWDKNPVTKESIKSPDDKTNQVCKLIFILWVQAACYHY